MSSLIAFISWYLIITLLGWLTFPLAYVLFPALADRGYSLSRAAGLLIWTYVFWLLTSLGLTQNTLGGILFGLAVLVGLSGSIFFNRRSEIALWLRRNQRLVLLVESLFLVAFGFLAFIRAGNPELDGTERPMELMFINAILRSPTFPPHDGWLSGYAISYYYFGYVMTAMLAKLSGVPGSLAHNLMTALIFGLTAVGAYGILYNLLAWTADRAPQTTVDRPAPALSQSPDPERSEGEGSVEGPAVFPPLLAPLFLLVVSNLEGFLEVLHLRGVFWPANSTSNFWTWLGIKELNDPPAALPGSLWPRLAYWWNAEKFSGIDKWFGEQFAPNRFWWWWRASRVVSDFDLRGNFQELIDEFPFFSFLLGDLHPHVLAIPFTLLAIAIALNIFLGGWRGEISLFGFQLQMDKPGFFAAALVLGGLAFLNTWDILVAVALIVLAYVLIRVRADGWSWSRLEDVFVLGLPLGLIAILLYLPFYFGFSSQAGGILPDLVNPTRGAQLWVMFASLWVPLLAYLIYLWRGEKRTGNWLLALLLVTGLTVLLWAVSWLLDWLTILRDPGLALQFLASQGGLDARTFFVQATARRLAYLGGLLTLLAILAPALAFLTADRGPRTTIDRPPSATNDLPSTFVLLLTALGGLLVLAPEFFYLRDQFGWRINTIFKFYYQAWLLWSLVAAFAVVVLIQKLRGAWNGIFFGGLAVLLCMSLTYPVLSLANKTNNFHPPLGWTLDDFTRIQRSDPDEAAAMAWLKSAPDGIVVEAVGGSYTGYARISTYTGLPSVLGWPGHESQWRGGDADAEERSRQDDIATLYATRDWQTAHDLLKKYNIRYVYIGGLERSTYPVEEDKFHSHLVQVFQQGSVTIYQVP